LSAAEQFSFHNDVFYWFDRDKDIKNSASGYQVIDKELPADRDFS